MASGSIASGVAPQAVGAGWNPSNQQEEDLI